MSLCVFIGEGKSEVIFFKYLLLKFSFLPETSKQPILYRREQPERYWLLAHPRLVGHTIGGKHLLEGKTTYQACIAKVENHLKRLPQNIPVHYRILRDSDSPLSSEKETRIRDRISVAATPHLAFQAGSLEVCFCNHEIEAWFLANLEDQSEYVLPTKHEELRRLLLLNPDEIVNPKEVLNSILLPEYQDNVTDTARLFGETFVVERVIEKSESFKRFYRSIEELI